jgi:hypothetical protein
VQDSVAQKQDFKNTCHEIQDFKNTCHEIHDFKITCHEIQDFKNTCHEIQGFKNTFHEIQIVSPYVHWPRRMPILCRYKSVMPNLTQPLTIYSTVPRFYTLHRISGT